MKGRVYDPTIGRFLSQDPYVVDPLNSQHYNRYTYVANKPVTAIDQTGYEIDDNGKTTDQNEADAKARGRDFDRGYETGERGRPDNYNDKGIGGNNLASETVSLYNSINESVAFDGLINDLDLDPQINDTGGFAGFTISPYSALGFMEKRSLNAWDKLDDRDTDNHIKFGGLLALDPDLSANGLAAFGSGLAAKKGLYNSSSEIEMVTVALGLAASIDTTVVSISYKPKDVVSSPLTTKVGFDASAHALVGGRVSFSYSPPSEVDFSVDLGLGWGAGFHSYSIGKSFD